MTLINPEGVVMGAEFLRFLGAEFFRFLGAELFSAKKQQQKTQTKGKKQAHHLHLLVQGHGSVFFFLLPLLINTKKTKQNKKHSPSSEENTLLMLS